MVQIIGNSSWLIHPLPKTADNIYLLKNLFIRSKQNHQHQITLNLSFHFHDKRISNLQTCSLMSLQDFF